MLTFIDQLFEGFGFLVELPLLPFVLEQLVLAHRQCHLHLFVLGEIAGIINRCGT
jgi:hypothetical protein